MSIHPFETGFAIGIATGSAIGIETNFSIGIATGSAIGIETSFAIGIATGSAIGIGTNFSIGLLSIWLSNDREAGAIASSRALSGWTLRRLIPVSIASGDSDADLSYAILSVRCFFACTHAFLNLECRLLRNFLR